MIVNKSTHYQLCLQLAAHVQRLEQRIIDLETLHAKELF